VPAEFELALEYPFKPTAIKALGIKEIEAILLRVLPLAWN
jgi:hypothetical protein